MRIELNNENTAKARTAEQQLRDQYGISLSPNQIVNLVMSNIDIIELKQVVSITFKTNSNQTIEQKSSAKKKIVVKTNNWVMNFK